MFTNKAINAAINHAKMKESQGLLIASDSWNDAKHAPHNRSGGDEYNECETVYSLILLYSDDEDEDTLYELIESALWDLYPNYF